MMIAKNPVFAAACIILLVGCFGKQSSLESLYGTGLSFPAKYCMAESGDSDPKFYECTVNLAIGIANSSLCEEVFSESPAYHMGLKRDSCLFRSEEVAFTSGDCLAIRNESLRGYCIASSGASPEACLSLSEQSGTCVLEGKSPRTAEGTDINSFSCRELKRSDCLLSIGSRFGNASACELIQKTCDISASASCRMNFDICFTRIAELTGNPDACKKLGVPFVGSGLGNYDLEKAMEGCNLRAFNSTKRLYECTGLSGKARSECIAKYAVSAGDPTLCDRIGAELRGVVQFPVRYDEYVLPHGDWSAFAESRIHDECITNLAISLKRPSLCEGEFLAEDGSSFCFFEAAINLGDSALCQKIKRENAKASCEAQLSGKK
ncbi:MAG: hypothetical protein V1909_00975 [Candidatus Micrarchaeota archaeon]